MRDVGPVPTKKQPLAAVLSRLRQWFQKERLHGHEVRSVHIRTRLLAELQSEVACQSVLQQHEDRRFNLTVLIACQKRVALLTAGDHLKDWFHMTVFPRIGAVARVAGRKSAEPVAFELDKARLTWATMDRALWTLAQRNPDLLVDLVSDPAWVVKNLEQFYIVGFDHSPLWVKFQGEDKVLLTEAETQAWAGRRRCSKKVHAAAFPDEQAARRRELLEHVQTALMDVGQDVAQMCQGGDKYRITIVTFQAVSNWFNPDEDPKGHVLKSVLIVPCSSHVRLSDIDRAGRWTQEACTGIRDESGNVCRRHRRGGRSLRRGHRTRGRRFINAPRLLSVFGLAVGGPLRTNDFLKFYKRVVI